LPSNIIASRLLKQSKYLKIYKLIKKYYLQEILKTKLPNISLSSSFLFFYKKYNSFKDFDRTFFWKLIQLECMFSIKVVKKKKKKKN